MNGFYFLGPNKVKEGRLGDPRLRSKMYNIICPQNKIHSDSAPEQHLDSGQDWQLSNKM